MKQQILHNDWAPLLANEFQKPYYEQLRTFLKTEYATQTIYPDMHAIFNALHHTPFEQVKVVILGQDPYHGPNQAHGLSFSVQPEVKIPPSLRNMYKELHDDLGLPIPAHGYLVDWAKQGVLLLNTVLTVRAGQAHSHRGMGWETFTDRVIDILNTKTKPVVYILWGSAAQSKIKLIDTKKHYIIRAPHPSPLSAHRGFFGSKPYSKTNAILLDIGLDEINWELPPKDNYSH
ncbi:uracil-DNA glycosylase [Oceanobacillus polygoni]|uniref:Uracil-DNA glycosylase n=1 Tax=Oceanobacillus polygoni TaxID=1235259 RepID=A0A9X0YRK8_9BACI|nr:uracil-DNA glycosylase [Oceanobacillus polygoni]MBP2077389.1 uracil-DNA glycosylase [Oceanobacillus polygoni]